MKPVFTVIAGPNGSGKSTLTAGNVDFSKFPLLDPDSIARTIQPTHYGKAALMAGRTVLKIVERQLASRQSFAVETTLSGKGYLATMERARELGFHRVLVYIGTENVAINLVRVANRVQRGGHDVPEEDVRRRYIRSFEHLPLAIARADETILFDNSEEEGYQLVAVGESQRLQWFEPLPRWAIVLQRKTTA